MISLDKGTIVLQYLLLAGAFFIPVANTCSQFFLYLSALLFTCLLLTYKPVDIFESRMFRLATCFALIAILSLFTGIYFERTLDKLHRLCLLLTIPAIAFAFKDDAGKFSWKCVVALLLGTVTLAIYDTIRYPIQITQWELWEGLASIKHADFTAYVQSLGNMRDPQFYMVGLLIAVILFCYTDTKVVKFLLIAAMLLIGIAFIYQFKRGSWFAFGFSFIILISFIRRPKLIFPIIAVAVLFLAIPQVRERLTQVVDEFDVNHGGRLVLWTKVAPKVIQDHPLGVGYKATRWEDFHASYRLIAPDLDHLHNNILQITAELGWLGIIVWLVWMVYTVHLLWLNFKRSRAKGCDFRSVSTLCLLVAFIALLFEGMVEYNFGDGEIFMLFCMIFGLAELLRATGQEEASLET